MSPPPRQEADDYLNVHRHRRDGRIHHRMQARKHHNTREYSGEMSLSVHSIPSLSESKSRGGRCESCGTSSIASDAESASDAPLLKSVKQLKLQTTFLGRRPETEVDAVHVQERRLPDLQNDAFEAPESPAVLALRSLTMPHSEFENTEPQGLRRMSSALSNTFYFLKTRTPTTKSSRKASKPPEENERRRNSYRNNFPCGDISRRRPTFKESKGLSSMLGTPATITLRKASNVYAPTPVMSSMAASIINEDIRKPSPEAPAAELLAFYTTPTFMIRGLNATRQVSPHSGEFPSSLATEGSSNFYPSSQTVQKRSMSTAKFNQKPNVRRSSNPAEATLTFADVYVAPRTFAVEPNSRKRSLIPGEALRRISVVHFRSRNSVHEIIWREDETTSGSSLSSGSRTSASPLRQDGISRSGTPSPEERLQPTQGIEPGEKVQYGYLSQSPAISSRPSKPQDHLFKWSWKNLSSEAKDKKSATDPQVGPLGVGHMKSTSDPGLADPRTSPEPLYPGHKLSSTWEYSEVTNIQSFPPLRPRSSTSEWRRAPLVDLNDPLAGRIQEYQERESTFFAGLGSGIARIPSGSVVFESEQLREHPEGMRLSSHPYAPPRMGPSGRMGSRSSSHMKVVQGHRF